MNLLDLLSLALRNLRQAKLRTALTVIGVVIGVAAIISMVSFGIGLQQNIVANALAKLDVFTSITVFGASADALLEMGSARDAGGDAEAGEKPTSESSAAQSKPGPNQGTDQSSDQSPGRANAGPGNAARVEPRRALDDAAVAELEKLGGVKYVLPNLSFSSYVQYNGRTRRLSLSGVPMATERIPNFKRFLAGRTFSSDDADELIVSEDFEERFAAQRRRRPRGGPFDPVPEDKRPEAERVQAASQLLGKEVTLLTLRGSAAAPSSVFGIPLLAPPAEAPPAEGDFGSRFERHVFRIVGVLPNDQNRTFNPFNQTAGILVPVEQAKRFREANRDPLSRMGEALAGEVGYQSATVRVADPTQTQEVLAQVNRLGFRGFSLTNQIEEVKRVFLIINGSLALIGGIALLVASFGISNTMIMSITERTREIGIMKAIGGSDGEIMRIFFFEASLIGLVGGVLGVTTGWVIDRIANSLVNAYVVKSATRIEFFSIPWYLWGGAILFAILISLMAAAYPASRAARVDPIKALRHD